MLQEKIDRILNLALRYPSAGHLITRKTVDELGLRLGMKVTAIAKATDIVILTDEGHSLSSLSSLYRTLSSSRSLPPCG
jgi:predicted alpha/beta-hydrolase family hydrolase